MIVYVLKAPFPFLSLPSARDFFTLSPNREPVHRQCLMRFITRPGRLATSRPLGERSEPFLAAKRPTASDEVARGRPAPYEIRRRTFLKVSLAGSAKKEQGEKSCIVSHVNFIFIDKFIPFCKQCLFLMLMRR